MLCWLSQKYIRTGDYLVMLIFVANGSQAFCGYVISCEGRIFIDRSVVAPVAISELQHWQTYNHRCITAVDW